MTGDTRACKKTEGERESKRNPSAPALKKAVGCRPWRSNAAGIWGHRTREGGCSRTRNAPRKGWGSMVLHIRSMQDTER